MSAVQWVRGERGTSLVELLVASGIGLGVVLAAVHLLALHARLALQVQADLTAVSGAAWALGRILDETREAGADPSDRGVSALESASPTRVVLLRDQDGNGRIDPRSAESTAFSWSERGGGRVSQRVGRQSMPLADGVRRGDFRLRYFDGRGREVAPGAPLSAVDRQRVRRVEAELGVEETLGTRAGEARLRGAVALRMGRDVR